MIKKNWKLILFSIKKVELYRKIFKEKKNKMQDDIYDTRKHYFLFINTSTYNIKHRKTSGRIHTELTMVVTSGYG